MLQMDGCVSCRITDSLEERALNGKGGGGGGGLYSGEQLPSALLKLEKPPVI